MGTRNLTCVVAEGEFKVAQYGQWDGYPTGQGDTIREFFARPDLDLGRFRDNVLACSFITEAESDSINVKLTDQLAVLNAMQKFDKPDSFDKYREAQRKSWHDPNSFTHLSRDVGANILSVIYARPRKLVDSREFAADGLFCEWAYVVDLDGMQLEIYEGFKHEPARGRFAYLNDKASTHGVSEKKYYPASLVKIISLHDLPTTDMAEVEAELCPEEPDAPELASEAV